jgi:hypothetical protein
VPLAPPAEPIEGDSHQHLIAPLQELARELGYRVEVRNLPETTPGGGPVCGSGAGLGVGDGCYRRARSSSRALPSAANS